jgi:hypothetical protein
VGPQCPLDDAERRHAKRAEVEAATQVVYPPPQAMREGWASVRSASGDLLVFVSLEHDETLCGVFDGAVSEAAAVNLLDALIASARTLQ